MRKLIFAILIATAIVSLTDARAAAPTCTFEACLAYCKKVGGVQCAMYCNKELPKREASGVCKNGKPTGK